MPYCIVSGCSSKGNRTTYCKGVILHSFPCSIDRIKDWLQQIGQEFGNLDTFAQKVFDGKKNNTYRICSEHFAPDCYMVNVTRKILRDNALPTIFPNRRMVLPPPSKKARAEFGVEEDVSWSRNVVPESGNILGGGDQKVQAHNIYPQRSSAILKGDISSKPSHMQSRFGELMSPSSLNCTDRSEYMCSTLIDEEDSRRSEGLVSERRFIVFESCLDSILKQVACACGEKTRVLHKAVEGTYLRVIGMCSAGHESFSWESQPLRAKNRVEKVQSAAALLLDKDGSSNRSTPERFPRPLYSRDSTQEHQEIPQEHEEISQARPLYSRDSTQEHHEIPQEHQEIPQEYPLYSLDSMEEHQEIPQVHPLYSRDSTQEHQEIPQEHDEISQARPLYSRDPTQEHQQILQEHLEISQAPPLYSRDPTQEHQDSTQEHQEILQKDQDEMKIEMKEKSEETSVRGDEPCKETPAEVSTDTRNTQRDISVEEEEEGHVRIKEEETPIEISTDGRYRRYATEECPTISPDGETEEKDILADSSEDNSDKMSATRKSYSVEYKKRIVEDSCGKNLTAYCQEKKLDLRLVRKWRADYNTLSQQVDMGNAKKRKCGSGRQTLFPHLEDITCEWIADRRAKALDVRRADIQAFALTMAPVLNISPEEFKASQHWVDNFLQRYELSKTINNIIQAGRC